MEIKEQAIFQVQNKDQKTLLEDLYKQYGKQLYGYATLSWKMDEDIAWDLVYKTLYKVIDSYQHYHFDNEEKFTAFIFRIFINYLRNHYRDNKKLQERLHLIRMEDHEINEQAFIEEPISNDNQIISALKEILQELEDWQRILLLMRSEGHSYNEIALYVDKPEEQLKVYYQRLKISISKKINERIQ